MRNFIFVFCWEILIQQFAHFGIESLFAKHSESGIESLFARDSVLETCALCQTFRFRNLHVLPNFFSYFLGIQLAVGNREFQQVLKFRFKNIS